MANYQEDATYSETGETFKDKDCRVLSLSLGREEGAAGEAVPGGAGGEAGTNLLGPEHSKGRTQLSQTTLFGLYMALHVTCLLLHSRLMGECKDSGLCVSFSTAHTALLLLPAVTRPVQCSKTCKVGPKFLSNVRECLTSNNIEAADTVPPG